MEFDGYPAQNLLRKLRFLPQTELHPSQGGYTAKVSVGLLAERENTFYWIAFIMSPDSFALFPSRHLSDGLRQQQQRRVRLLQRLPTALAHHLPERVQH